MGFASAILAAIATLVPLNPANLAVSFGTIFASGPKRPLRCGHSPVVSRSLLVFRRGRPLGRGGFPPLPVLGSVDDVFVTFHPHAANVLDSKIAENDRLLHSLSATVAVGEPVQNFVFVNHRQVGHDIAHDITTFDFGFNVEFPVVGHNRGSFHPLAPFAGFGHKIGHNPFPFALTVDGSSVVEVQHAPDFGDFPQTGKRIPGLQFWLCTGNEGNHCGSPHRVEHGNEIAGGNRNLRIENN